MFELYAIKAVASGAVSTAWSWIIWLWEAFYKLFGIAGVVGVCVILFYEGVPLLRHWPFSQIPAAGYIFTGEIERRIIAHDIQQLKKFEADKLEAEKALAEQEKAFRKRQATIEQSNQASKTALQQAINEAQQETDHARSDEVEALIEAARAKREVDRTKAELQLLKDNPEIITETVTKTIHGECKPKVIYRTKQCNAIPDKVIDALEKIQ